MLDWLNHWLRKVAGHHRQLPRTLYLSATQDTTSEQEDVFAQWEEGPLDFIPRTRSEMYDIYGDPGVGRVDKKWERRNMVVARGLPGGKNRYVHRKMEPYLREALRRCQVHGCLDEIKQMGSFAFRHQRHDPSRPLSDHAFGIAVDINPAQNTAKRYPKRNAPDPFSDEWRLIWPNGLGLDVVRIFEAVGFEWGGRWKGFPDPMHFSLRQRL